MIYSSFIPSVARQIFALVAIFALFLTSVPLAQANPNTATYDFTFVNGVTISGVNNGFDLDLNQVHPGEDWPAGVTLHLSCSAVFENGWNIESGGFPNQVNHSGWQIASYSISRVNPAGKTQDCDEIFVDIDPNPPVDLCPNLDGIQVTLPSGYEIRDGSCVEIDYPVDECPDGTTGTYPDCEKIEDPCADGEIRNDAGDCVPELVEECPVGTTGTYPDCVPIEVPCEEGEARNDEGDCVPVDPETPRVPVTVCKYDAFENRLSGWTMYGTNGELTVSDVTDEDGCVTLFVPLSTETPISVYEENREGWTQDSVSTGNFGNTTVVSEEDDSVLMCEYQVYARTLIDMTAMLSLIDDQIAEEPKLECYFFNREDEEEGGGGDSSSTSTGGGGGGYTPRDRDAEPTPEPTVAGDSISTPEPTPAVLGDQVSAVPYGAPNTGTGGTAAVQFGFVMNLLATPRRFLVK